MTARDLKRLLVDVDDEAIVILASDEEGNNFYPLAEAAVDEYSTDDYWGSNLYLSEGDPIVVLWP